jgi:hypothetical protein
VDFVGGRHVILALKIRLSVSFEVLHFFFKALHYMIKYLASLLEKGIWIERKFRLLLVIDAWLMMCDVEFHFG